MNDPRRLLVLRVLARTDSITQAARLFPLTPPAVSQQLAAFEKELGVALVDRSVRAACLTAGWVEVQQSIRYDPADPDGIWESATLHNRHAYALYRQHTDRKRRPARPRSANDRNEIGNGNPI